MAEEEANQSESTSSDVKKKSPVMLVAIIAILMIMEGAGIFVFVAMTSKGPKDAFANTSALQPDENMAELLLIEDKFNNSTEGRTYRFEVEIYLKIREENKEFIEKRLEARKNEIRDRVGQIIRTTQVSQLREPDLRNTPPASCPQRRTV